MKLVIYKSKLFYLLLLLVIVIAGCRKNLPDDALSLSKDTQFTKTVYEPVLGRNNLFSGNFNAGTSSLPLNFKIVNMRRFNGESAPELNDYFPVKIWKQAYDGNEKSLAEIEAKRGIENHKLFEIREHSGQFLMWDAAKSDFVKSQPDSGYVFDVEMSNSGGKRYFQKMRLRPFRERPYEPSNFDAVTGQEVRTSVNPSVISNIRGERTNRFLGSSDVQVLFNKVTGGPGNTISFKFVDTLFRTIDPNKFATTQWENVVHGFNMVKTSEKVTYQVAYPIPLNDYPTRYTTSSGAQASSLFRFERIGFGNILQKSIIGLNYNIYEKGDWEIIFWFKTEKPKFVND
ncbi:hypothetical protein CA265_11190 [Sphingobacteriaceae bacterium GW460-11-11-14-LB5]|nr:hypothetical protein CA265_11190 [Sphingobacteriaceae bacterium GW460-11-11-14-LB5]